MNVDEMFHFQAWFKILDKTGNPTICIPDDNNNNDGCPSVTIFYDTYDDISTKTSITRNHERYKFITDKPYRQDEWNSISGFFKIHEGYVTASRVFFYIEAASEVEYTIDNVTLTKFPCDRGELIKNGDFENGITTYWDRWGYSATIDITEGYRKLFKYHLIILFIISLFLTSSQFYFSFFYASPHQRGWACTDY